jgi:hypothetical protein
MINWTTFCSLKTLLFNSYPNSHKIKHYIKLRMEMFSGELFQFIFIRKCPKMSRNGDFTCCDFFILTVLFCSIYGGDREAATSLYITSLARPPYWRLNPAALTCLIARNLSQLLCKITL